MAVVVDASVTMAWCFEDEATAATDAVLDRVAGEGAVVPALWVSEVANVLVVAERRRRITEAQSRQLLGLVQQLPIDVDPFPVDPAALVAVGRQHGLSAYDAGYLLLAERLGAPLATLDADLARACRSAGVTLLAAP